MLLDYNIKLKVNATKLNNLEDINYQNPHQIINCYDLKDDLQFLF